jgi:carbon monoxide dehydrogenase subunit G
VRPKFSFLTGSMQMIFDILEADRPTSARMRVTGKGIGASLVIETSINLSAEGTGTRLDWESEVTQMSGLVKALSRSLIEGAARRVVADSWAVFRTHLSTPP